MTQMTTFRRQFSRGAFVIGWLCFGAITTRAIGQGACCLIDDCVQTQTEEDCSNLGGVFLPGESCDEDACGEGACCFEDNCAMTDAYSCIASGRTFAGAGTTCLDDPCDSNIGACCLGEDCLDLSPKECDAMGGTWLGAGTSCDNDPCTVGACCVSEDCVVLTQFECDALEGTFFAGTDCAADPCSKPLPECPKNTLFGQQRDDPDDFLAGTSEFSAGFTRFENFSGVAGSIESVRWWGLDLDHIGGNRFVECVERDPTFTISFHEDAGGVPGAQVCSYALLATREPLGIFYLGAELNRYEVQLTEPCVLVNGWISIVGLGDPECWFLWMSAGFGESYCDGCAAPFSDYDLSLCLAGTEGGVFGACCIDETAICTDNVEITDCAAGGMRFEPGLSCDELDPPCGVVLGACCFEDATCSLMTETDCAVGGGSWHGANTLCDQCPCITPCPDGGIDEGEPICEDNYIDTFNGGCTAQEPHFSPLNLGETVCGTSGVFFNGVDNVPEFDWYQVEVVSATLLTWTATAEFVQGIWIVDANAGCPGKVLSQAAAFECDEISIAADVGPGTYWLVIAPVAFTDTSICGARYTATAGPAPCVADLDGDGTVGASDLLSLLVSWGPCKGCPADFDGDGTVGASDLLTLLANWGPCP